MTGAKRPKVLKKGGFGGFLDFIYFKNATKFCKMTKFDFSDTVKKAKSWDFRELFPCFKQFYMTSLISRASAVGEIT